MVKKFITVIQVLLVLVFVGCAGYIGKYFYDARMAQKEFDSLKAQTEKADASGNYEEKRADNGMLLKYFELYNQNNDLAGWLKIPDTVIDYPVMQAKDNDYYLHRDFYKNYQYSGIPFLDFESGELSLNHVIYAHNMRNGSMFAAISKYEKEDFYNTHRKINYDTLYDRGEYDILSVLRTTVGSKNEFKYYEYADIEDERSFREYVRRAKMLSIYDTGIDASYGDRLITLSTCAYHRSNERLVIIARKKNN